MGKKKASKKSCADEDSVDSDRRGESGDSEEELISIHPEKADFDESAFTEAVTVTTVVTNHHKRKSVIVKLKSTDLDNFAIHPGIAILKPREKLEVSIERRPHKATRNHKVEVHFVPARSKSPGDLNKAFKATSPSSRNVLTFLLRVPKEKKDNKKKSNSKHRRTDHEEERQLDAAEHGPHKAKHQLSQRTHGTGDTREPPPPLALDNPDTRLFFFPPYDKATETSFLVRNPSPDKRVAVKMKCSDLSQFEIRPSICFMNPGAKEEIVVRRKAVTLPASAGHKPELLVLQNVEVTPKEADWARTWKEADKAEVSSTTIELELRNEPYIEAVDSKILFFKPHSVKALASLTLQNLSPFNCLAKCYCGNNEIFRVNPVRFLVEPNSTKAVHFSVAKLPLVETKIQVDYTKCDEEDLEALRSDRSGKKLDVLVDAVIKGKKGKVLQLDAVLKMDEEDALKVVPEAADLRRCDDGKWRASLKLHNLSSARVAVKVKALDPKHYAMSLDKAVLEPGEVRELSVETHGPDEEHKESAMRLDFAFALPSKAADAVFEDAKTKDALAHHRVPITYAKRHKDISSPDANEQL